ncbi:unnamed protein product, partial [Linum tenue]
TTRASLAAAPSTTYPTIPPSRLPTRRRRSIRASRRRRAPLRGDSSSVDADDSSIPTPDLFLRGYSRHPDSSADDSSAVGKKKILSAK